MKRPWQAPPERGRFRRALAFRVQRRGEIVTSETVNTNLERLVFTAAKSPEPASTMALSVLLSCLYPEA